MLSLELIDAELVLAKGQGEAAAIVAAEPGVALLEDAATVTGTEAARRVRRSPLLAQNNFWRGLSTQALMRPSRTVGTTPTICSESSTSPPRSTIWTMRPRGFAPPNRHERENRHDSPCRQWPSRRVVRA